MLKITTRLSHAQEEEYIEQVAACMKRRSIVDTQSFVGDFERYIFKVLRLIGYARKMDLLYRVLHYFGEWKSQHSTFHYQFTFSSATIWLSTYVMAWLVMPYDLMKDIKPYVQIICSMYLGSRGDDKDDDSDDADEKPKGDNRWKQAYGKFSKKNVNNWIVSIVGNRVCPYCNLSFIYNRTEEKTTAELDHFYCKSYYPLLALCFYNLIPVCHSCNHIKHEQDEEIVSPYEENAYDDLEIDWTYVGKDKVDFCDLEKNIEIIFNGSAANKEHLSLMNIKEAYDQHKDYAAELIQKIQIYNNPAARELLRDSIEIGISAKDIEEVYFGKYRNQADKRILGKMTKDFLKKHLKPE